MTPSDPDSSSVNGTLTVGEAFARYEAVRPRLPQVVAVPPSRSAAGLLDIAAQYDGFLFDSFGVLNVGDTAIAGAADCLMALRALGKPFCVLTNAASYTAAAALLKYRRMGLDVRLDEIISSRDVTFAHLDDLAPGRNWAAIPDHGDSFADSRAQLFDLLALDDWSTAEGFVFLSAARWTTALQDRLVAELTRLPRPVVIGNPDLVAPRETGLTIEPGFWAHDIQDRTGVAPQFFGKPYAAAFRTAIDRIGVARVAMVGDTLHTDILGAQACGLDTILVTRHGMFAGHPVDQYIAQSGIAPTWILPQI